MMEDQRGKVVVIATNGASAACILDEFQFAGKPATFLSFVALKIPVFA